MRRTAAARRTSARAHALTAAVLALLLLVPVGCGDAPRTHPASSTPTGATASPGDPSASPGDPPSSAPPSPAGSGVAMPRPGPFEPPLRSADVLVVSTRTLGPDVARRVGGLRPVAATERFAMAQFYYHENEVSYAAVDPASFRSWTQPGTAESDAVWNRVADGEIAIRPKLGKRIEDDRDFVQLGGSAKAPTVHVGAYAQMLSPIYAEQVDAVVNQRWVHRLHMVPDNALLVSTDSATPDEHLLKRIRGIAGKDASVQILSPHFDVHAVQTAILTGESISSAVGTFNYTANPDGSVNLPGSWVAQHIRTKQVPILGTVTCNQVMLDQLVDVMREIQQRGLAKYIDPGQYGGCFVPRYIAGTHTLSYHAFGLAIDLNVPENQRGTVGQMNRQVVGVFEKWGFEWGGTWHYTDPMHFELHRIVKAG